MLFAIFRVVSHGVGRRRLGNGLEEDGAPSNVDVGLAQGRRKFHLDALLVYGTAYSLDKLCIPR